MKVVVGLGNPGDKYAGTRHNVGFEVLDELSHRHGSPRPKTKFEAELREVGTGDRRLLLVAPQTYMNLSGRALQPLLKFYQVSLADVLVVCDDLNLKCGQLRLRASGSAGGQKGLLSIVQVLGTELVPRLRIGIDRPPPPMDAAAYVLARFRSEELPVIDAAVRRAADGIERWAAEGLSAAMNWINGPVEPGQTTDEKRG
jgi:PTH1 family peptidyl-tRNA hydrolase